MEITLDQWESLVTVVDSGSYAKAAEQLDKSQSSVSYSIQKMEEKLQLSIFRIEGRKAVLTDAGQALYQQARNILDSARQGEELAQHFTGSRGALIRLAIDAVFSEDLLLCTLARYAERYPFVRIELLETVLSGTEEALMRGKAEIVIAGRIPPGFSGDALLRIRFVAVAHPDHPLHHLDHELSYADLRRHRQLVVRDSGSRGIDVGWLGADKRWTVSNLSTSIHACVSGLGFAWYPQWKIQRYLDSGQLKPLPLNVGVDRYEELYLIMRDGALASPAVKELSQMLGKAVSRYLETGQILDQN